MSDTIPSTLRYTKDHEWARLDPDGTIVIGITLHAVEQLGDVTMVGLPAVGGAVREGQSFGDIDSVKAVSELYAPMSGTVVAVNTTLDGSPEQVNSEPYGAGWMVRIRPDRAEDLDGLLSAAAYAELIA